MVSAKEKTYWTPIQAVAWLATGDYAAVEFCSEKKSPKDIPLLIWLSTRGYEDASKRLSDAIGKLQEALLAKKLIATGRKAIKSPNINIPDGQKAFEPPNINIPGDQWPADFKLDLSTDQPELDGIDGAKWSNILLQRESIISLSEKKSNLPSRAPSNEEERDIIEHLLRRYKEAEDDGKSYPSREGDTDYVKVNWPWAKGARNLARKARDLGPENLTKSGRRKSGNLPE